MTISAHDLALYALAMAGLWIVPGPVWVALVARSMAGGFAAAWPLAVGVALGDLFWPMAAILGLTLVGGAVGPVIDGLRWVAAAVFLIMGVMILRAPGRSLAAEGRLTRPGLWAGFTVGLAAVIGNPKAIGFYLSILPGFFRPGSLTWPDIAAIAAVSALVPIAGNLGLALSLDRARRLLSSPAAVRRLNVTAGVLLIGVAGAILLL